MLYYLPSTGGRKDGFILFPKVLVHCEIQAVSFRIWTLASMSSSFDANYYTTGTFIEFALIKKIL